MSDTQADLASAAREAAADHYARIFAELSSAPDYPLRMMMRRAFEAGASWAQSQANPKLREAAIERGGQWVVRNESAIQTLRAAGWDHALAIALYIEAFEDGHASWAQSAAPVPLSPPTNAEVKIAVDAFFQPDGATVKEAMRVALTAFIASRGKAVANADG